MMDISSSSNCPSSHESRFGLPSAAKGEFALGAIDLLSPSDEHRFKAKNNNIESAAQSLKDFVGRRSGADNRPAHVRLLKGLFTETSGKRAVTCQSEFRESAARKKESHQKKSSNLQLQEVSEAGEKRRILLEVQLSTVASPSKTSKPIYCCCRLWDIHRAYVFQPLFKEIGEQQRQKLMRSKVK